MPLSVDIFGSDDAQNLPPHTPRKRRHVTKASADSDCARCNKLSDDLAASNAALATANAALDEATRTIAELEAKLAAASSTRAVASQIAAIPSPLVAPPLVFFSPDTSGKFELKPPPSSHFTYIIVDVNVLDSANTLPAEQIVAARRRTVTKCGETHWARQRIETLRYLRVTQPDGSETKPYADQERVKMIVVSARTPETRGEFDSTLDAATYEEQLLFAHRAHFSLANDNETAGRGKADTRGAQLLVCANNNERDKKAMIKRVDELLAAPVFVDETKCIACVEQVVDEKTGKSAICSKTMLSTFTFEAHLREHRGAGFKCTLCGIITYSQKEYLTHWRSHEPMISCPVPKCMSKFKEQPNILRHINSKNTHKPTLSPKQKEEFCKEAKEAFNLGRAKIREAFKAQQEAVKQNS